MHLTGSPLRGRVAIALLSAAAMLPARALAADNPAEALEFEEIEVVGTTPVPGVGAPLRDVPANVQIFGGKEIERQNPQSAAEFLWRNAGGVTVNDGQGNPYQPDVSFRGFTASPLLGTPQGLSVFLDGVRVNEPFGDVVNWDLIPPGALSSVQVIPGSTPALGLNNLGGAVALYTKSGSSSPGLTLDATGGSFGRLGANLEAGASRGSLDGFVAASFVDEKGWADHNPSRVLQLFAKTGYQTETADLDLSLLLADTTLEGTQTLPLSWIADRRTAYTYPDQNLNTLAHAHLKGSIFLAKAALLGGSAYYRGLRSRNTASNVNDRYDPADPTTTTAFDDRSSIDTKGYGAALQLTLTPSLAGLGNQLALGVAADVGHVDFVQETRLAEFTADRGTVAAGDWTEETDVETRTTYLGVYASDTLSVTDRLALTLSARFNRARVKIENRGDAADDALNGDHEFDRLNPAAGLAWTPGSRITAYAAYNEGMRVPTPMELTCADPTAPCKLPNSFLADPPLKKVVSRTMELGARGKLGSAFHWSGAIYRTQLEDDIQFINDPQSGLVNSGFFANVGQTRRQGIEVGLGAKAGDVTGSAAYGYVDATFQTAYQFASATNSAAVDTNADGVPDTVFVEAGNHIPGIPAHNAKLRLDWSVTRSVTLGGGVVLASSTYARGDENNHDANGKVPGYSVVSLDGSWRIAGALTLGVKVTNLLDTRNSNVGVLGENFFTGPSRTFGPAAGVAPAVEQFRSVGAPRGAWVTLSYAVGGKAVAEPAEAR
jgi:outer membrane receptor protein involved in Fe transport